jgi:hypothetical protein
MPAVKGAKRVQKVRPALEIKTAAVLEPKSEHLRAQRPSKGSRDPEQRMVDDLVRKAYDTYIAAGKPKTWDDMGGGFAILPDEQVETLKWRIGLSARYFSDEETTVKITFGAVESEDGFSTVVFTASEKEVVEEKDATAGATPTPS